METLQGWALSVLCTHLTHWLFGNSKIDLWVKAAVESAESGDRSFMKNMLKSDQHSRL